MTGYIYFLVEFLAAVILTGLALVPVGLALAVVIVLLNAWRHR